MGHEVEKAASARGHQIVYTFDNLADWGKIRLSTDLTDVVIDFSSPLSAAWVVNHCLESGVPVVSGSTGWAEELEKAKNHCRSINGAFFYAPNFSIGVNIFFEINRRLAKLIGKQEAYKASLLEIHHIHKLDAPSGTAIALANDLIAESHRYKTWKESPAEHDNVVPVTSLREGEVPGTHLVQWSSLSDTIEIKHTAHNRQGFATGAVLAAEWMVGRSGVFGMDDLLKSGT